MSVQENEKLAARVALVNAANAVCDCNSFCTSSEADNIITVSLILLPVENFVLYFTFLATLVI